MTTLKRLCLLLALACAVVRCSAQHISGSLPVSLSDRWLRLLVSRGSAVIPVDSARIDGQGRFDLGRAARPAGFYHLVVNDSDAVDFIIDARETEIVLNFNGSPLQEHIAVSRSEENKRLWQYKFVSRETQAVLTSVSEEKSKLRPTDTLRLQELDSTAARAVRIQEGQLDQLLKNAPDSYLAKVVRCDRALQQAEGASPMAVAAVFDLSDPTLMRSSVYDKAVMTFLRNVNAMSEEQFVGATDTLISLAGRNAECRSYMIDHLLDLFSTYGPDLPLQRIIDRYVVPEGVVHLSPALREKVDELMKVAVGAIAPDPRIPTPAGPRRLSELVGSNKRTVIFFYSSTCDHCHKQMPPLKEIYRAERDKGLGVIGIALDTDSAEFKQNITDMGITWPCYSEFTAWGGEAPRLFQVKATPAFYLLDDRMRILAKPVDAADLQRWLEEHPGS